MRKRSLWGFRLGTVVMAFIAIVFAVGAGAATVLAVDSSSENYQITEWQFGSGATLDSCSDEYCAQATIGDPGAASSASTANFGEVTTDEPMLEVIIEPGESNLGTLSTERTATKVTSVKIRNNFEGGYTLQVVGEAPKFGNHILNTPATPTESRMGTEQFGINLTANTVPTVGSLPVQIQNKEGEENIFGEPTENYRTPNRFMYEDGGVIAQSVMQMGRTDYTISMIVNIANTTPAGHYSGDLALFIVPLI